MSTWELAHFPNMAKFAPKVRKEQIFVPCNYHDTRVQLNAIRC